MEEMGYFNEKEYIEGFNLGYKISKEVPELGDLIYSAKGMSSRLEGLKDGREQYLEDQLEIQNVSKSKTSEKVKENDLLKSNPLNLHKQKTSKSQDKFGSKKLLDKTKDIEPEI